VLIGLVYAVMSMGLALIFGVLKIPNFAHGDFVTIGMYLGLLGSMALKLPPFTALVIAAPGLFIIGLFVERVLIRPTMNRPVRNQLVLTAGLSLVIENLLLIFEGPNSKSVNTQLNSHFVAIGPAFAPQAEIIAAGVGLVVAILLILGLRMTESGRIIRATVEDREMATLVGINGGRVFLLCFGLGSALAGIAGSTLGVLYPATPTSGQALLVIAFVSVTFGGAGSIGGACVASVIVGIIQQVTAATVSQVFESIPVYLIFIVLLLVRPQGLLNRRQRA
jgi:branched-chain amino acid transport system permease protein